VIGEPSGLGAKILFAQVGSADAVTAAVDAGHAPGTENSPAKIPFTPNGKAALEQAIRFSNELSHDFVGTEHLLLGLLSVTDGKAARVLNGLGVELDATRTNVTQAVDRLLAGGK
jgi:hypothetical protein